MKFMFSSKKIFEKGEFDAGAQSPERIGHEKIKIRTLSMFFFGREQLLFPEIFWNEAFHFIF